MGPKEAQAASTVDEWPESRTPSPCALAFGRYLERGELWLAVKLLPPGPSAHSTREPCAY